MPVQEHLARCLPYVLLNLSPRGFRTPSNIAIQKVSTYSCERWTVPVFLPDTCTSRRSGPQPKPAGHSPVRRDTRLEAALWAALHWMV